MTSPRDARFLQAISPIPLPAVGPATPVRPLVRREEDRDPPPSPRKPPRQPGTDSNDSDRPPGSTIDEYAHGGPRPRLHVGALRADLHRWCARI